MNDTKELRRLAQAALIGPDGFSMRWLSLLKDFQEEANPSVISEIIDRLEAAEKDIALKERVIDSLGSALNAAANERDALRTELAVLRSSMTFRTSLIGRIEAERDALLARIEAMEKQEPIVEVRWAADIPNGFLVFTLVDGYLPKLGDKFYALPGAQPAPIVRPAALYPVISWLRNGCDPMKAADELEILTAATEA